MAKVYVQSSPCVWGTGASIAATGTATSGSFWTKGYSRLTGTLISSASLKAGSGLRVSQSSASGTNWDYISRWAPSACSGSAFSIEVVGDRAQVDIVMGATDASLFRTAWRLRPV